MTGTPRLALATLTVVVLASLLQSGSGRAATADSLTAHDKAALELAIVRRFGCAHCDGTPDVRTARWRFASDIGTPRGFGVAYVVVSFRSFAGDPGAMLFGFYPPAGRWRFLVGNADGSNRFTCGRKVLLNASVGVVRQRAVLGRVARCS